MVSKIGKVPALLEEGEKLMSTKEAIIRNLEKCYKRQKKEGGR